MTRKEASLRLQNLLVNTRLPPPPFTDLTMTTLHSSVVIWSPTFLYTPEAERLNTVLHPSDSKSHPPSLAAFDPSYISSTRSAFLPSSSVE